MAETGQLPTSGSSTDALSGTFDKLQAGISNEDIKQALSPTLQRQPIQLPSYFTTPRAQVQPPAQMDHREVVGAGNARAQGIGNAVSAGVRTLGNFIAVRKNQQQAAEATKVQRFLAAQYEHDQAAQILQQDPKNQQAAAAQKQAQDLMTGMLTDKKFATTLEKGFQISLTDPSQNKTDHHSIVQKGIELFKKQHQQPFDPAQAQQMLQKFRAQMPQQLGQNPQAMQQLQTKLAVQKAETEWTKAWIPFLAAQERGKAQLNVANVRGLVAARVAGAMLRVRLRTEEMRDKTLGNIEASKEKSKMNEIYARHDAAISEIDEKVRAGTNQASTILKLQNETNQDIIKADNDIAQSMTRLGNLTAQRDASKDKAGMNAQIKDLQDHIATQQRFRAGLGDNYARQLTILKELNNSMKLGGTGNASTSDAGATDGLAAAQSGAEQLGRDSIGSESDWNELDAVDKLFQQEDSGSDEAKPQ